MTLFEKILESRGLSSSEARDKYLLPRYEDGHDPFLLPDMRPAVDRLKLARSRQDKIVIYGDYDIDGLTASTLLTDAFEKLGFKHVQVFIPNRFVEGYGMTKDAVTRTFEMGANLIVTVDCGSLSEKEIIHANSLGVDVIVTDHHNVAPVQPPAVAVINPKRLLQDNPKAYKDYILINKSKKGVLYPFLDLPGVGVAFKLVQAMQTEMDGLPLGQEKWLLDLVALGTVCDVVNLTDENRIHVFWGIKVMAKTRRPGLKALMAVASVEPEKLNARSLGFALGPRMNASGRLETAEYALEMLVSKTGREALAQAERLDMMNETRRSEQDKIFKSAVEQATEHKNDSVLVVSSPGWNHGIIGIVAAKLLEKFKKPTFVLEEIGEESKGSARSYGDFSAADGIRACDDLITKGGGHKLAAGVTLPTKNIDEFRKRLNEFYASLKLENQEELLKPVADVVIKDFSEVNEELVQQINQMEPFGNGNPSPILKIENALVMNVRRMGADSQHLKIDVMDKNDKKISMVAFNADESWKFEIGDEVTVFFEPILNEWNGNKNIEGRLLDIIGTV